MPALMILHCLYVPCCMYHFPLSLCNDVIINGNNVDDVKVLQQFLGQHFEIKTGEVLAILLELKLSLLKMDILYLKKNMFQVFFIEQV